MATTAAIAITHVPCPTRHRTLTISTMARPARRHRQRQTCFQQHKRPHLFLVTRRHPPVWVIRMVRIRGAIRTKSCHLTRTPPCRVVSVASHRPTGPQSHRAPTARTATSHRRMCRWARIHRFHRSSNRSPNSHNNRRSSPLLITFNSQTQPHA